MLRLTLTAILGGVMYVLLPKAYCVVRCRVLCPDMVFTSKVLIGCDLKVLKC